MSKQRPTETHDNLLENGLLKYTMEMMRLTNLRSVITRVHVSVLDAPAKNTTSLNSSFSVCAAMQRQQGVEVDRGGQQQKRQDPYSL